MLSNKQIYFDVAATTPIDQEVLDLIHLVNKNCFGNPSSTHQHGQKSHNLIEKSRISIAKTLNCKTSEIIFTSGGSESNNHVLKGILKKGDHLITSSYEHPSILKLAKKLRSKDIEVSFIKPDSSGLINPKKIERKIKHNTKLISIMYVNNEIGSINQINKISKISKNHGILFHTDAVQIIGKKNITLTNIDFMSIGAHKFYGPKGAGALFIKKGLSLNQVIYGGGQENGYRPGTESVSLIAGMSEALKIALENLDTNKKHIQNLENLFFSELDKTKISYTVNGKNTMKGFINITFHEIDGQSLLMNLDINGIGVSFGSACSSGTTKASNALLEIGLNQKSAKETIRISIGNFITEDNIFSIINSITNIVNQEIRANQYV